MGFLNYVDSVEKVAKAIGAIAVAVGAVYGGVRWSRTLLPKSESGMRGHRLGPMPAIGRRVLGREKVTEDLHARLLARRAVAVATGQGGIGKTTLARHYVETHGKHYRGVLWVRAEEPTMLVADL
ncbi:MAG: hypothetical protein JNK88_06180, partial [Mangrovicoccus sp.]|nr:hypothetical protein [Mangrovicoccus sp.]